MASKKNSKVKLKSACDKNWKEVEDFDITVYEEDSNDFKGKVNVNASRGKIKFCLPLKVNQNNDHHGHKPKADTSSITQESLRSSDDDFLPSLKRKQIKRKGIDIPKPGKGSGKEGVEDHSGDFVSDENDESLVTVAEDNHSAASQVTSSTPSSDNKTKGIMMFFRPSPKTYLSECSITVVKTKALVHACSDPELMNVSSPDPLVNAKQSFKRKSSIGSRKGKRNNLYVEDEGNIEVLSSSEELNKDDPKTEDQKYVASCDPCFMVSSKDRIACEKVEDHKSDSLITSPKLSAEDSILEGSSGYLEMTCHTSLKGENNSMKNECKSSNPNGKTSGKTQCHRQSSLQRLFSEPKSDKKKANHLVPEAEVSLKTDSEDTEKSNNESVENISYEQKVESSNDAADREIPEETPITKAGDSAISKKHFQAKSNVEDIVISSEDSDDEEIKKPRRNSKRLLDSPSPNKNSSASGRMESNLSKLPVRTKGKSDEAPKEANKKFRCSSGRNIHINQDSSEGASSKSRGSCQMKLVFSKSGMEMETKGKTVEVIEVDPSNTKQKTTKVLASKSEPSQKSSTARRDSLEDKEKPKDTTGHTVDSLEEDINQFDNETAVARRSGRLKNRKTVNYAENMTSPRKSRSSRREREKEAEEGGGKMQHCDSTSLDKGPVKLAPLFLPRAAKGVPPPTPPEDPAVLAARKEFLLSGLPEEVKRVTSSTINYDDLEGAPFPEISHVRQTSDRLDDSSATLPMRVLGDLIPLRKNFDMYKLNSVGTGMQEKSLVPCNDSRRISGKFFEFIQENKEVLEAVCEQGKNVLPSPPHILRDSLQARYKKAEEDRMHFATERDMDVIDISQSDNDSPVKPGKKRRKIQKKKIPRKKRKKADDVAEILSETGKKVEVGFGCKWHWTEKYAPSSPHDLIGNNRGVHTMFSWLSEWKKQFLSRTQIQQPERKKEKRKCSTVGSSSESDSDTEWGINSNDLPSCVLIHGPPGCGKTSSVFAVANTLGFKVFEVHASHSRSGKQVLQHLREATLSHQVKGNHSEGPRKDAEEDCRNKSKKALSLILFDDIDLVFDDLDLGLHAAVRSLLGSTKRPVVMTASSPAVLEHSFLAKAIALAIPFFPVASEPISLYLQLASAVEGFKVNKAVCNEIAEWSHGDVRKGLINLQLLLESGKQEMNDIFEKGLVSKGLSEIRANIPWQLPLHLQVLPVRKPDYIIPPLEDDDGRLDVSWASLDKTIFSCSDDEGGEPEKTDGGANCRGPEVVSSDPPDKSQMQKKVDVRTQRCLNQCVEAMAHLSDTFSLVDTMCAVGVERIRAPAWWGATVLPGLSEKLPISDRMLWQERDIHEEIVRCTADENIRCTRQTLLSALQDHFGGPSGPDAEPFTIPVLDVEQRWRFEDHYGLPNEYFQEMGKIYDYLTKSLQDNVLARDSYCAETLAGFRSLCRAQLVSSQAKRKRRRLTALPSTVSGIDLSVEELHTLCAALM